MRKIVLLSVLLLVFLSVNVVSAANSVDQDIFVSVSGNDSSNTGANINSPYATIAKGVSDVNESCRTTIHLSQGTFNGEGNTGVVINKAHRSQGGSLTILGAGYNKTFIDGESVNRMFDIKADSVVKLVNITFINGKEANGGSITNAGDLDIANCIFENNYATSNGGVIYSTSGSLNISDSNFNNNSAGSASSTSSRGGVIHATSTSSSISNSSFINNHAARSGAVYLNNGNITNSYFANNYATNNYGGSISITGSLINNQIINSTVNGTSGRGGAVYLSGSNYLKNNTMTNCSAPQGQYIYNGGNVNANVTFADITITAPTATVNATVTDDLGHSIYGGSLSFYANDNLLGSASAVNGTVTLTYTKLLENNGLYNLTGVSTAFNDLSNIKNGTLTVNIDRTPIFLYVSSTTGSDDTGDGSISSPYSTISKAINEGFFKSLYPTVYILEGIYSGAGNTNISITDLGVLSLIGVYNKTIINGGNINWIFKFDQNTQVNMVNLTIKNGNATPGNQVLSSNSNLNIENCIFENNYGNVAIIIYTNTVGTETKIKNSIFKDNQVTDSSCLFYIRNGIIDNSSFINNSLAGTASGAMYGPLYSFVSLVLTNSRFINNQGISGGAVYANGALTSINNTFSNNSANGAGALYAKDLISENDKFYGNIALNSAGGVSVNSGNITGATFINNTAGTYGGAISALNLTISNCTFVNNTAVINGNDIYQSGSTYTPGAIFGANLTFVGNSTANIHKIADNLTATVTMGNGTAVGGGDVLFYLNGIYIGKASVINGLATLTYVGFKNGTYNLTGTYSYAGDPVYTKDGMVKVTITELDSVEYYVSKSGNDITNDGTRTKPFATIQKALITGFEFSRNITIHLLEGVYSGVGNTNVTLPGTMNITIIGEGVNKTVIDGENSNWIFNMTMGEGLIILDGLSIINSNSTASPITIANTTVKILNSYFGNNTGFNGGAINNQGNLTINNTYFVGNLASSRLPSGYNGGGAIFNDITGVLTVHNASIINNNATSGTGIYNVGKLIISNSLIKGGVKTTSTNFGSAIYGTGESYISIINCIFTNNTNNGVHASGFLEIYNSTFHNGTGIYVGEGNHSVYNSSFTGITNAITLQGGNLTVVGCLFENNTYALYSTSSNSAFVNISNSVILDPIQVNSAVNLTADYNWWGNNTKPVIIGPGNLILDYWLVMTLLSDDKPGFSKGIKAGITHYTDGVINYAFDGYLPVREYLFGVSNGAINPVTGNLTDNIVGAVFNAGSYGNHTVNVTIDNQTLTHVFELFQVDSSTTVGLSDSAGKVGDKVVITVEVKDKNGNPINGGEVEFFIGTTSIVKVQIVNGKAVKEWTVTGNSGEYEINARYLGSDAYRVSDNYAIYMLDAIAPVPKASIKGGSYNNTKKVTLTATDDQDSNPKIYYTIDGTTPTTKSALYDGPISIGKTTILKFIAVDSAGNVSPVQTETYIIDTTKPNITSIDPSKNATKIAAGKTIKVAFSEAIKKGSKFWIELKNSSGKAVPFNASVSGKVLTVDPTGNLAESLYTLIIHTGAVTDMVGNPVALTSSKFSVGTSPSVTKIDPKNGATKVAATKTIKVTFNENIKKGGKFWVELKNSSKKAVSFTSSVSGKVLTIKPKSKLAESLYTLIIHTGAVTDLAGNPVALKSSKFSVGTAPKVSKIDPKNGATKVAATKAIKVTFNENIKKGGNFWVELLNSGGKGVSFTSSVSGKVLTIKPKNKLAESLYTLIIHTGAVTDLAGNPVALKSSKFSVGTPPKVTKSDPKNNAKNIARTKTIKVTFNENIKKGSNYWIELVASNGTKIAIKKSIKDKVLTITPTKTLKANTKYKLVLHTGAVTDTAGNPVALKTINFTTRRT